MTKTEHNDAHVGCVGELKGGCKNNTRKEARTFVQ